MKETMTDTRGRTRRWPRFLGAILVAAGAQAGLGAWAVGGGPVAAYLGGCAVTAGVVGLLLLVVPLPGPVTPE